MGVVSWDGINWYQETASPLTRDERLMEEEVKEAEIDYEKPSDRLCPECRGRMMEQGKNSKRWLLCYGCYNQIDLPSAYKGGNR